MTTGWRIKSITRKHVILEGGQRIARGSIRISNDGKYATRLHKAHMTYSGDRATSRRRKDRLPPWRLPS
jgi:hypothetical protein